MAGNEFKKWKVFGFLYVVYMVYYFNKKNYGLFLSKIQKEQGLEKDDVAQMGSAFEIGGVVGSFFGGLLIDSYSPRWILGGALAVSGVINISMSQVNNIHILVFFKLLNGLCTSFGWPSLAKIFVNWFTDPAERGKWYSILSTNQNIGSAMIPFVLLPAMSYCEGLAATLKEGGEVAPGLDAIGAQLGWRVAMVLPGVMGIAYGALLIVSIEDGPDDGSDAVAAKKKDDDAKPATKEAPKKAGFDVYVQVMKNPAMWGLFVTYFCIAIIRGFISDWIPSFIEDEYGTGKSQEEIAGLIKKSVGVGEMGGLAGSISAGIISDTVFRGRRGPVITIFTLAVAGAVAILISEYKHDFQYPAFFMLGFSSFAPHVLIGLAARELVPPHQSSTAGGLVTMVSRAGGVFAAAPLATLQKQYQWSGVLTLLVASSVFGGLATTPLWNMGGNDAPMVETGTAKKGQETPWTGDMLKAGKAGKSKKKGGKGKN